MSHRPAFNWICVLCTAADILVHAANIRATQIAARAPSVLAATSRKRKNAKETLQAVDSSTRETLEPSPGSPFHGAYFSNDSIGRRPLKTSTLEAETVVVPSRVPQQLGGFNSPFRQDEASLQEFASESSEARNSAIAESPPGAHSGPDFETLSMGSVSIPSSIDNSLFFKTE
jgi:hypothetical protein